MTIDEAIKFCHEKQENIKLKAVPQVFVDIANMLKELKIYKECNISKANFSMGYNKAIDDFAEKLKEAYKPCEHEENYIYQRVCNRIDEIAEQLKDGDSDGM